MSGGGRVEDHAVLPLVGTALTLPAFLAATGADLFWMHAAHRAALLCCYGPCADGAWYVLSEGAERALRVTLTALTELAELRSCEALVYPHWPGGVLCKHRYPLSRVRERNP